METRKQIILEATAKFFRHATQGLKDIIHPDGYLKDDIRSYSQEVHPFERGGWSPREMQDASSEDHAQLLAKLFGKPVSYMTSTYGQQQTFKTQRIREIQGPRVKGFRYSSLGYVKEYRPRSVVWHSLNRAQQQIKRSMDRLMAKHPGYGHPDADVHNAQINSHRETYDKLEDVKHGLRFGALSDVSHPLDDEFYYNYGIHAPRVEAQIKDAITGVRDASGLFSRKAVKSEPEDVKSKPKALPPGSEEQKTKTESVRIAKIDAVLTEIVKKEGKQWVVRSEKGKNLGKFSSEAAAKNRLRQVEYFKHAKQ